MQLLITLLMCQPAEAVEVLASMGIDQTVNDPYLRHRAYRVGVDLAPIPALALTTSFSLSPEAPYTPLTQYLETKDAAPHVSRTPWRGTAALEWIPVRYGRSTLGLYGGLAVLHTVDDLELINSEGDPSYEPTKKQVHTGTVIGAQSEARWGAAGLRVRLEQWAYMETIGGAWRPRRPLAVGLDLICVLGAP